MHRMTVSTSHEPGSGQWHHPNQEGQLAIDVYEGETEVVVLAPMAGVDGARIDVNVHNNDLLTIRGERRPPVKLKGDIGVMHQECFWGKFSRSIVLPIHVRGDAAKADYKNGVLTIRIPKYRPHASIPIEIVEE